jgi:hypothetical protein
MGWNGVDYGLTRNTLGHHTKSIKLSPKYDEFSKSDNLKFRVSATEVFRKTTFTEVSSSKILPETSVFRTETSGFRTETSDFHTETSGVDSGIFATETSEY